MRRNHKQRQETIGPLSSAPRRFGARIDALMASSSMRKLADMDARAGRLFSRLNAAFRFAVCIPILAVGYLAWLWTDGWAQSAMITVMAILFFCVMWCAVARLRNPQNASEILIENHPADYEPGHIKIKPTFWK